MELTKKQLKQIISEEVEKISESKDSYQVLVENYADGYGADTDSVPKQALIDLLEVLEENQIPRDAFEAFMESLDESKVSAILKEVLSEEE